MPRSALTSLLAISLLAGACDKNSAPAETPDAATAAADAAAEKPDFSQTDCKDWSTLDLATLPTLPESEYTATFEVAWSTLLSKHYDPTLGCKDWVAVRAWYGDQVAQADDSGKAYALMNGMLGELEQSHIAIVPPGSRTQGETRSGTIALTALTHTRASALPSTSMAFAALSTIMRMDSISTRARAIVSTFPPSWAIGLPNALRDRPRRHINSIARSAAPIERMQWWIRPGPRRT